MTQSHTSLTGREYRAVMGHFCTGVAIVTGSAQGRAAGFTAQSVQSISLDPPLVSICPAKSSSSWPTVRSSGYFCVNFLATEQHGLCHRFAQSGIEKFKGSSWSPGQSGSPIIDGVLGFVDCRIEAEHDAGDHTIVIGRVLDLRILHPESKPLLFFRGQFGSFEEGVI